LGKVAELVKSKEPMSGTLNLKLAAEGSAKDMRIGLQAGTEKLQVAGITRLEATADARYDGNANLVNLSSLEVNTSDGQLRANGRVALDDTNTSAIDAQLSQLNLLSITRALDLPMKIASTATGSVKATFRGTQVKKANGQAQLRFVRLRSRPLEKVLPLSGSVKAIARGGAITLLIGNNSGSNVGDLMQMQRMLHPASMSDESARKAQPAVLRMSLRDGVWRVADRGGLTRTSAARQEAASGETPAKRAASPVEVLAALLRGRVTLSPTGELSGTLTADFKDA
jgi:hypothetical protein